MIIKKLIIGGMPGSGSSLLFEKLKIFFNKNYFESGYFCNNDIYGKKYKENPFNNIAKSSITKVDLNTSFIEKTPENIFYFYEIKKILKDNFLFVCTVRDAKDSILSLYKRTNCIYTSFYLCVSSLIVANEISDKNFYIINYKDIIKKNLINKLKTDFKLNKKKTSKLVFIEEINTWNYSIYNQNQNIYKSSNPKVNFFLNNLFIKYKNNIFNYNSKKTNIDFNYREVNLANSQIFNFLKKNNLCLLEKY